MNSPLHEMKLQLLRDLEQRACLIVLKLKRQLQGEQGGGATAPTRQEIQTTQTFAELPF